MKDISFVNGDNMVEEEGNNNIFLYDDWEWDKWTDIGDDDFFTGSTINSLIIFTMKEIG